MSGDPYTSFADVAPSPEAQPGAVFTDTGLSGTGPQVATYQTLAQTGGYDPSQQPGSQRNPFGLRPGASIPAGAWYTDQRGGVYQAGDGGVQMPATPQTPQGGQQGGSNTQGVTTASSSGSGAPAAPGGTQLGGDPYAPFSEPAENVWGDFGSSIPTGLVHAATGVLGAAGDVGNLTDAGVQAAANAVRGAFGYQPIKLQHDNPLGPTAPTSADLNRDVEQFTGQPLYRPQGPAGRAVDTLLSFAPAAVLGPEGMGARALSVAVPAATSDIAGEAAHAYAPSWEPAARLAGGLVGGFGVGAAMSAPGSAKVIASGASSLSDADLAAAQSLSDRASAVGVPITLPEAVSAATGKGVPLLQAQRAVESTPTGSQAFAPYMAARPGQMQRAVGRFVGQFGPGGAAPSVVAPQAQTAAEGALTAERQAINAKADPYYAASRGDLLAPSDYMTLHTNPVYQGALQGLRANPELGPTVSDLPDNAVGVVDQVAKRLVTSADQARGSEMVPGDMQLAGLRQAAADKAFGIASAASPSYGVARQIVAQGRAATLDPLTAGPLGTISKSQSLPAQTGALFPAQPFPGQAADTAETLSRMGSIDPTAPGSLVGAHLGRASAEAFSDTRNGPNLYGGSKYALDVVANPLQAQNLQSAVSAVAGPAAASQGDDLLQALLATGRRFPPRQASNAEVAAALQAHSVNAGELAVSTAVPMEAAHNPLGLVTYPALKLASRGVEAMNNARASSNAAALAQMLQSPDPIATTVGAARQSAARGSDAMRAGLAAALLGTDQN